MPFKVTSRLLAPLAFILLGCQWDGEIQLADDTSTSQENGTNASSTDDTNTDLFPIDTNFQNDSDNPNDDSDTVPEWNDEQDILTVQIRFPATLGEDSDSANFMLCANIISEHESEITPFTYGIDSICDPFPHVIPGEPTEMVFPRHDYEDIHEKVFISATLFIDRAGAQSPPVRGKDYWGVTNTDSPVEVWNVDGTIRAGIIRTELILPE